MSKVDYVYTKGKTKLALTYLGSGGEGAVYEIQGHPGRVAKIYKDESADERSRREEKIDTMVEISQSTAFQNAKLSEDIAWPLAPLYDELGHFVGFGMNKILAKTELDDLYAYPPKNNISVTIKDRIKCLISLCDVIDRLHQTGQIFGDFNPNNIKIKSDWSVNFVDADSYHVKNAGKEYRCVVCASGYVAPEVIRACKGTTYANCKTDTFTKETDQFALAIHIFRMLMNGCHPYICERHLKQAGSTPAPKPLDKRVESGETPFFKPIPNYIAPRYAPEINTLPPYIRELFRLAFVDGHINPKARPTASDWKAALIRFSTDLDKCGKDSTHYFWKGNSSCPYCAADLRYQKKVLPVAAKIQTAISHQSSNSTNTSSTYKVRQAASTAATTSSTYGSSAASTWFWVITLSVTVIMQILMGLYLLPNVFRSIFDNEILAMVGMILSLIAGVAGTIIFNSEEASGSSSGTYTAGDYIFSILMSIVYTVGFGIAFGLLVLAIYIIYRLFIGLLVFALVIGLFSGG